MTAHELVDRLLEVYGFPSGPRAGSPEDPWRKSGHKPLKFKRGDFEGKRTLPEPPKAPSAPGVEDTSVPITHKKPPGKHGNRFNWKPPQG